MNQVVLAKNGTPFQCMSSHHLSVLTSHKCPHAGFGHGSRLTPSNWQGPNDIKYKILSLQKCKNVRNMGLLTKEIRSLHFSFET